MRGLCDDGWDLGEGLVCGRRNLRCSLFLKVMCVVSDGGGSFFYLAVVILKNE